MHSAKGVNAYLEKHKYANATSEDFFAAVTAASGKPVDRVMGTFVLQPGVPQLDVSTACAGSRTSSPLLRADSCSTARSPQERASAGRFRSA